MGWAFSGDDRTELFNNAFFRAKGREYLMMLRDAFENLQNIPRQIETGIDRYGAAIAEAMKNNREYFVTTLKSCDMNEDPKFYYINDLMKYTDLSEDDPKKMGRIEYQYNGVAEEIISLLFKWLVVAFSMMDPKRKVEVPRGAPDQFGYSWPNTHRQMISSIGDIINDWIQDKVENETVRKVLLSGYKPGYIAKQLVGLSLSLLQGKNYDQSGSEVGMAMFNMAIMITEGAKHDRSGGVYAMPGMMMEDKVGARPREKEYQTKTPQGRYLGSGGNMDMDNIFVEYFPADLIKTKEKDISTLIPPNFIANKHGQIIGRAFDQRLSDRSKIPHPTFSVRPDWVGCYEGATILTGECKSHEDVKEGLTKASIAACHQFNYSDTALLLLTTNTRMRLYKYVTNDVTQSTAAVVYEGITHSVATRDSPEDLHKDVQAETWKNIPKFNGVGGLEEKLKEDSEVVTKWDNLTPQLKGFTHACFEMIDVVAAEVMKLDLEKIASNRNLVFDGGYYDIPIGTPYNFTRKLAMKHLFHYNAGAIEKLKKMTDPSLHDHETYRDEIVWALSALSCKNEGVEKGQLALMKKEATQWVKKENDEIYNRQEDFEGVKPYRKIDM